MPSAFNCTMCSAPLDLTHASGASIRCKYCGNTVILPEELRGAPAGTPGLPLGESFVPMIDQALKLAEIARLAKAGKKIQAIKLYRETFGTDLRGAKDAVEQMEAGQAVVFSQGGFPGAQASGQPFQPSQLISEQTIKRTKRIAGFWLLFIILIPLAAAVFGIIVAFRAVSSVHMPSHPTVAVDKSETSAYADVALEFGKEGIGPAQFKDARSVAIDGQGRIYVAEYSGGRVQVFDGTGNFITQWMVDPKRAVINLAADRKGIVYVVHPTTILRYDGGTGNLLGEVGKPEQDRYEHYSDVFVALDGSLYAIGNNSNIIHIGADGAVKNVIKVSEKVGGDIYFSRLAVDGVGNIYTIEDRENAVYKFAPDGRYINKFGGKGREAGQLTSPENIVIDGQGRVFVSDAGRGIQVFDGNGRYLDGFGGREVYFGMALTDHNEILAAQRNRFKVVKFALKK